jgi:hypothetical protein
MDATMECYTEYGAVRSDAYTLRVIIELLESRPTAPKVKLDYLQSKINEYIQSNPRRFLNVIKDPLLSMKVLIKKCVEHGLISMRNNLYYLREDNSPLCEMGEDSTLNNAARYIGSVKRQEVKYISIAHCGYPKVIFASVSILVRSFLFCMTVSRQVNTITFSVFSIMNSTILPTFPLEPQFASSSPPQSCVFLL